MWMLTKDEGVSGFKKFLRDFQHHSLGSEWPSSAHAGFGF